MAPRRIGPLSTPPASLEHQDLPVLEFRAPLVRVHRLGLDPAFWGKTGQNRFDAPSGEFGVLYAATDHHGAFIETYGDALNRILTTTSLHLRGWARIEPLRNLRLVDLTGPGLAQLGADERLCSGEHDVAQQWSLALWRHSATVDGLFYRSRHDPSRTSVALFDRADTALAVIRDGELLNDRHLAVLAQILETYHFALL